MKNKYFNFVPITVLLIFLSSLVYAQPGCPNIDAGPDQTLTCTTTSTNLTATVLATGATTSYAVSSIFYAPPYPYNSGTAILVGYDDIWSDVINIPFNFCFFGISYNQIVVGANGCISFNTSNVNQPCAWSYSVSCPNPNIINGFGNDLFGNYVSYASVGPYILGPYHDIDPSIGGSIKYSVQGTYPCRMFVLNYYQVPMFDCTSLLATHQIVLYESTNVIEVYIQNAPVCTSWNDGNKCIGVQNAAGTLGSSPPGRNTGAWSATNEAWRFTPNGTPNYSITWWQGATQIGTTATITVSPTTTTTYTAQVVYDCCTGLPLTLTDSVNVIVGGSINLTINPANPAICAGGSSTLTASSSDSAATFQWNTGTPGASITVYPTVNTTYTVTATTPGCTAQASVTVTITPGPTVTVNDTTICSGQPATLTASGATTYVWSTGNTNSSIIVSPTVTTTYTVTGTDGCTGSASGVVTVNPPPNIQITTTNASCNMNNGSATASGGTSYIWNDGQTTATATGLMSGNYTVTTTDINGCSASTNVIVGQTPGPSAGFSANPEQTNAYIYITFLDNSEGNVVSWQWDFGDGCTATDQNYYIHQYGDTGTYTVTLIVTDTNGCIDSVSDIIKIRDISTLYIPNTFTPNGDGINDFFFPQGVNVDPNNFDMYIFDRLGNLMFHTNTWISTHGHGEPWNGTKNNRGTFKDVVMDVYVYRILAKEIQGHKYEYIGRVTLMK